MEVALPHSTNSQSKSVLLLSRPNASLLRCKASLHHSVLARQLLDSPSLVAPFPADQLLAVALATVTPETRMALILWTKCHPPQRFAELKKMARNDSPIATTIGAKAITVTRNIEELISNTHLPLAPKLSLTHTFGFGQDLRNK